MKRTGFVFGRAYFGKHQDTGVRAVRVLVRLCSKACKYRISTGMKR